MSLAEVLKFGKVSQQQPSESKGPWKGPPLEPLLSSPPRAALLCHNKHARCCSPNRANTGKLRGRGEGKQRKDWQTSCPTHPVEERKRASAFHSQCLSPSGHLHRKGLSSPQLASLRSPVAESNHTQSFRPPFAMSSRKYLLHAEEPKRHKR